MAGSPPLSVVGSRGSTDTQAMSRKVEVRVVGEQLMHCTGCGRSIEFILSQVPGVEKVLADHEIQLIEVTWTGGSS